MTNEAAQSSSDGFVLRPTKADDVDEIINLLELGIEGWPRISLSGSRRDHWIWKYEENPIPNKASNVTLFERKIVACDHAIPQRVFLFGEPVIGAVRGDLTVHPDFRGKGIWRKSQEYATFLERKAGYDLVHYMTGNPIVIQSLEKRRPRFPKQLVNLVRIHDIDKHIEQIPVENEWLIKTGFRALKMINQITSFTPQNGEEVKVNSPPLFDEKVDELFDKVKKEYDFIVDRGRDYLNWRYNDTRSGNYIVKTVETNGQLLGYLVFFINRFIKEYPIGYIVDVIMEPGREDVLRVLIESALQELDSEGVNIVNYLNVKGHHYEKVFSEYGFLDSRIKIYMFYQSNTVDTEMKRLGNSSASKMFYTWGNHDSLPVSLSLS